MTPELAAACAKAVHVVTINGRTLRAGRASLFVLGELGWRRAVRLLSKPPFIWAVELGYRIVAGNRMFFSRLMFWP